MGFSKDISNGLSLNDERRPETENCFDSWNWQNITFFFFYLIDSVGMSFANPSIAFVLPLDIFFSMNISHCHLD